MHQQNMRKLCVVRVSTYLSILFTLAPAASVAGQAEFQQPLEHPPPEDLPGDTAHVTIRPDGTAVIDFRDGEPAGSSGSPSVEQRRRRVFEAVDRGSHGLESVLNPRVGARGGADEQRRDHILRDRWRTGDAQRRIENAIERAHESERQRLRRRWNTVGAGVAVERYASSRLAVVRADVRRARAGQTRHRQGRIRVSPGVSRWYPPNEPGAVLASYIVRAASETGHDVLVTSGSRSPSTPLAGSSSQHNGGGAVDFGLSTSLLDQLAFASATSSRLGRNFFVQLEFVAPASGSRTARQLNVMFISGQVVGVAHTTEPTATASHMHVGPLRSREAEALLQAGGLVATSTVPRTAAQGVQGHGLPASWPVSSERPQPIVLAGAIRLSPRVEQAISAQVRAAEARRIFHAAWQEARRQLREEHATEQRRRQRPPPPSVETTGSRRLR